MRSLINLIKGDKISQGLETDYRDNLPVNMTAVVKSIRGANGYMLSHYGLTQFATASGIDRGGIWNERLIDHYRVSGQKFVSVSTTGVVDELGAISGSKRASLAYSFNTQAIVADGKMWLYDGATLTEITDPELGDPIDIAWIDGYYVLTDGENIYHTDITDETSIDPIKFSTSEFSPDPTLAVDKTTDNQWIVFNRYSTEYFENVASANFAWRRISGKALKAGVVGTHCETELEGRFYILGGGKEESVSVHYISAGTYTSIATREVDKVIATYTEEELADAVLETRVQDKDSFILVRLPRDTLLFNSTVALKFGIEFAWTIVKTGFGNDPWRAANGVYDARLSEWIYGDILDGRLGILDKTVGSQYGNQVESILYTPLVNLESESVDEIELDIIPGHQIDTSKVTTALSTTYNGVTFGTEIWVLYGEKNKYDQRFIKYRLGYVRNFAGWKFRTITTERLAFGLCRLEHG